MRVILDKVKIWGLPVHDADLISLYAEFPLEGNLNVYLKMDIDQEESVEALVALGIEGRRITLIFEDC